MSDAAVRLADVAEQAGVSEATVSRVLNGKPGVTENTRQAVLTAMDLLGYERPARARQRSAGLIGLVVPELNNPIFPAFAQHIERTLILRGYTPVLCTHSPGGATEDECISSLTDRGVAGIVFISGQHANVGGAHERYTRLLGEGVPLVLLNGCTENPPAPVFSADDGTAVELAFGHLRALGHERIGLAVGPERFVPALRKAAAFRELIGPLPGATEDADKLIVHSLFSVEGGQSAAQALLDRGCTAVICGSDLMALGVIRAARRLGWSVPGELSVVGYDDSPLMAFTDPPLTTVRQPVAALATEAVGTLLDTIAGAKPEPTEYFFEPELLMRGSTAARPG
ncbi:LacI family transcriptional regulator [Tamaricihabitans halophyticus]|uniref:LacI family transcriptional regulator n=1 Tax=Tamaricihabitans halophyticus TaxID=1262583 RepID=A0A4R2Q5U9_9PSEU|nr:LacI family DNA-binding transcriptional regulator [Tamaricihabitans halophyticus]TCP43869.1 LacI family transcriptional regulator [Tamaricihabitans halophyticus]